MLGFAQNFGGSGRARRRASSWTLSAGSRAELACQGEWVYIEKVPMETLTLRVCFGGVGVGLVAVWGFSGADF